MSNIPTKAAGDVLQALQQALSRHDWYYSFADSLKIWRAGQEASTNIARLMAQAKEHNVYPEAVMLYNQYSPDKKVTNE